VTGMELARKDLKQVRLRLEAKVLVFDDLERAAMPVVEALGLINAFVEHGDFKVIVIANQAQIPDDQKAAYEKQREKLFGRTLEIKANPADVLAKLIPEMRCQAARDAVTAHQDLVIRVFDVSGKHNLRSLRAAIDDFDRLVATLDPRLRTSSEALRRLLTYLLATEMELRGGLKEPELEALMSVRVSFGAVKPSESPEIQKAQTLQAQYPDVEWRDPIIPAEVLARYLVTGVLDVDAANAAILAHPLIAEPRTVPPWRRLIDWQFKGAVGYRQDRDDVLATLTDHKVVEPGEICHIAGIALWLERMHAPLLPDIETDMKAYIDAVQAEGVLAPNRSIFGGSGINDSWAGYIFASLGDPVFVRIKAHLETAVAACFDTEMKAAAPALLERLRQPDNDGKVLFDATPGERNYGGEAILHHLDPVAFADVLVTDGRTHRPMVAALVRRYQYWGTEYELLIERPWLEALRDELDRRATALGPPFEKALKTGWTKTFGEIFGLLAQTEARMAAASPAVGPAEGENGEA